MLPARREIQTRSPTSRMVGPKPIRRLSHQGAPVWSGSALITTCLLCSSRESSSVFAKAGTSVLKRVVGFDLR